MDAATATRRSGLRCEHADTVHHYFYGAPSVSCAMTSQGMGLRSLPSRAVSKTVGVGPADYAN